MATLLIATGNAHKVQEIAAILGSQFCCLSLRDLPDAPAVVEDADTFAGNAAKKALSLARWLIASPPTERTPGVLGVRFVLADDSGLEVHALGGAPGVRSARFAADESAGTGNSPDAANNARLLRLLGDVPAGMRGARFRCVIALTPVRTEGAKDGRLSDLADEDRRRLEFFEGACEGRIAFEERGSGGFGYDPLFIPDGFEVSFAELARDVKNRMSHRARALEKVRAQFRDSIARST